MIRPKKNARPTGRLEALLKSECFKRLHEQYPESLNKVVGVEGNLADEKLGLKSNDYRRLVSEVSVVFHCAATLRFNDTLRNAVKINMEGTKSVLELCNNLKNVKGVTGVVTTVVADKTAVMDIIPVDVVANALIIAACQAALRGRRTSQAQSSQDLPVYNCTSGAINKISYGEVAVLTTKLGQKHTPETNFCRPGMDITMSPFYQAVAVFLFNYLPALFFDLVQPRKKQNMRLAFYSFRIFNF